MNRTESLLTILSEECAEVTQRVSKALRFGLDEVQADQPLNNAERILEELRDVLSIYRMLVDDGILRTFAYDELEEWHSIKSAKVEKWLAYANSYKNSQSGEK